ncbi:MAG: hypothetical protein KJO23_06745, partial [Bacteroidia bacterium]|nr:hypothetical protein [Bacteroidia bacterium]
MNRFFLTILLGTGLVYQSFAQYAKDGNLTINAANTQVNTYSGVTSDITAGATIILVNSIAGDLGGLTAGDLVLVYQAQGATINTTNDVTYGVITSLNGAGTYEYAYVAGVAGNQITLDCPLVNGYLTSGFTQVVKVPQYDTLTINGGGSIVPSAWQDSGAYRIGGIVAINAVTVVNNGSVDVSSLGFRGGVRENDTSGAGATIYGDYVTNSTFLSAEKGESIVGFGPEYDVLGGRYGRGAPANGGGGGNAHNAGGGGGANGNNGNAWFRGAGIMCSTCTGSAAWNLDPDYIANGNSLTNSSGGGRGGYTYASSNQNALSTAPSNSAWGGDQRDPVGGLGGRPLTANAAQTIFFGGGGGAGDGNNSANNDGGYGGGIILIDAGTISGSGTFLANGQAAPNTVPAHNDAPGGGGAGGTIVLESPSISNSLTLSASGGKGGDQLLTDNESEGPGGGGSGGYIAITAGTPITLINGGANGITSSGAVTEFPANGSTIGAAGQSVSFTGDIVLSCIVANNNDFSGSPIDGGTGGMTASVFPNDRLNGTAFNNANVNVSITNNDGLTGLTVNSTGVFTVPAGTTAGTYNIVYQICEVLVPTNCDTAIAVIVVTDPPCAITAISTSNLSACNDNGTPSNSADDFFTADVTVTFTNAPSTGTLDLSGDGTASVSAVGLISPHTFTGVTMSADGGAINLTATFSADTACTFNENNAGTAPASCSVPPVCSLDTISTSAFSPCNDNGTPLNSADDFFTADVTVTFTNAPVTGTLDLTGDGTASVSAIGLTSPHTFTSIQFAADGGAIDLTATFSDDTACTFNEPNAGLALTPCSTGTGDTDGDGVPDASDICPGNDDNADADGDLIPDGCDNDDDNDGIPDYQDDPCTSAFTFNQTSEGWFTTNNNSGVPDSNPASHSNDAATANVGCTINIYGPANMNIAGLSATGTNYLVDADDTGGNMWVRSPNFGGLNLSNALGGNFSYDAYNYRVGYTGNPSWGNVATPTTMQIEGTDGTIVQATAPINYTNWENGIWNAFSVPLTNGNWIVIAGTGNLSTVLTSIQNIRIRTEFINGGNTGNCADVEYYAVDNIVFAGPGVCSNDTDGDGIPNGLDLDADNDGIYDVVEAGLGGFDTNGDGLIDSNDAGFVDTNNDGIDDRIGVFVLPDSDGDGTPDYLDADSDNDGCNDADEAYGALGTDADGNGYYGTGNPPATNGDGTVTAAPYNPGSVSDTTTAGTDTDSDGIANFCDPDDDNDGNPDATDTNPLSPTATDDNGTAVILQPVTIQIINNDDYFANGDPSSTGTITITNTGTGTAMGTISFDPITGEMTYTPLASEGNTTVTVVYEVCNDIAPAGPGAEDVCTQATVFIMVIGDTDGDGLTDDIDPDPNNPCDPAQSPGYTGYDSSNPIWQAADCDGDGVTNGVEANTDGTDPYDPCDYNGASQVIANVSAAWNNLDCDGDGVTNGDEILEGTDPQDPCDFGIVNQGTPTSAWNLMDCDGDGVSNGQEQIDGTDPLDPCDYDSANQGTPTAAWEALDCDGDGVTNGQEIIDGTDPVDPCDYDPTNQVIANVTPAWEALDCDGDGVSNGQEVIDGTDPLDPCDLVAANQDTTPTTAWNDLDCDGDGVTNGDEIIDGT